ncbi:MAG: sigma-70 family RNA polymerase sigma factor [Betaproteobacteria bacterium]|nr:sigma-70 family RNA polymerase sigma factor [Betaproteobacteria bacterium]
MSDFAAAVNAQRAYLLRIARLQLPERERAEDVVQETILAALESQDSYAGKSSVKSWLTGILKHKIIDAIRRSAREPAVPAMGGEGDIDDLDVFFSEHDHDHWESKPADWRNPERDLEQKQFMDMIDFCLERLPPNTARVFMLHEVMGLESDEICKELQITATHLWVILYRARMLLRKCLEQNWFARAETAG